MRGALLSFTAVLFTLLVLGTPRTAAAQADRIPFLTEKLRDPDFRVRTNAALALGAVDNDGAVQPLCGALNDGVDVVRQATAAALQRLNRKAGLGCLTERAKVETNENVKTQIAKATAALGAAGGSAPSTPSVSSTPRDNADAKYYVQIAPIANHTDRKDLEAVVRNAVMQKLDALGPFQIAPPTETIPNAKAAMSKRKLKNGFYLTVSVQPLGYGSGISARVSVAISTYPGKSLKGELSSSSQAGGSKGDVAAENEVVSRAAQSAINTFSQNVDQLL